MTFGERLIDLRKEQGYIKRNFFAEKIGIPSTTLRNYETNVREPGHAFLKQISEFFNVSTDYLLCLTDEKDILSTIRIKSSEQEYLNKYRALDAHGKEMVDFTLEKEWKRSKEINNNSITRLIQYYYHLASAGTGQIVFDDLPTKLVEIPDIPKYKKVDYAISTNGDSMEPLYHDGDILLVEKISTINVGEIGIFIVDGQTFVKKLGVNELIPLNKKYPNLLLHENSRCLGRVIDILQKSSLLA